jgi:hypothetical protein
MEQLAATLIAASMALVGVVVGAILSQWLQARNRRHQFVEEGLLARYAEFVGVASAEEQRAETITILAPHVHDQPSRDELFQVDSQRHQYRRDLQRLAWQIQLLEHNPELRGLLQRMVDEMPFEMIVLAGERHSTMFNDGLERFHRAWQAYKQMLTRLVNLVQVTHLNARTTLPVSGSGNPS